MLRCCCRPASPPVQYPEFVVHGDQWEAHRKAKSKAMPNLACPRSNFAATVFSGSVVVGGGQGFQRADPENILRLEELQGGLFWQYSGKKFASSNPHWSACGVGRLLVQLGGWEHPSDAVEAVDVSTGEPVQLPPLPARLYGCGAVGLQGKLIVTGGYDGSTAVNSAWMLDVGEEGEPQQQQQQPLKWTPLPGMTLTRRWPGTAAGEGCVFVCGGFGGSSGGAVRACEFLRLGADEEVKKGWQPLPPLPSAVKMPTCCFGGGNVFAVDSALFALSLREMRWQRVAKLQVWRSGCAVLCVERRLMILGGQNFARSYTWPERSCEVVEF